MHTFGRLLGFLRPYKRGVVWSLVLAALAMVCTVAIPWLTGRAVDQISDGDRDGLRTLALAVVGVALLRLVLSVFRRLVAGRVSLAIEYDLRTLLYAHLQKLELGFFAGQQTGQLMSRATVDLSSVRFFLGYGLVFILQSGLTIVLGAVAMFWLSPGLAALALIPVPFVVVVATRYGRRSRPALQEVQQRIAEVTADVEENISGVRVVKAFAAEPRQLERFRGNVARVFDQSMVATRQRAFYNPFLAFLPNIGLAVILLVGGRQVINGTLTLGDFTAFYTYLLMLIGPMRMFGVALGMAQRATASGARLFEILDREPEIVGGAAALPPGRGRVELRDVTFGYGSGPDALRDVSLAVEPGSTVALVGATGLGQDDARPAAAAAVRPALGVGADRRRRRARRRRRLAARRDRGRRRRPVPVLGHGRGQHRLRAAGRLAGGDQAGRGARPGRRVHRRAAGRLRHPRRRARADAQRRPAPADRDRARLPGRPARADPRRRHLLGRRDHRARDQDRAARGHGGPHDVRDRPPAVDDRARRRHRRARAAAA